MNLAENSKLLALLAPIVAVQLALVVLALVVCIRTEKTRGPKWFWIILIVLGNVLGPVLFLTVGRRTGR